MSGWKFAFPASRTCLWDGTSTGRATELSKTKSGCLLVHISSSSLQLALNHAKSSSSKMIDCFMIASSWINEAENITLEVNRFDPGRPNKERTGVTPTSLMHGDIAMRTQVVFGSHPDSKYLTHNLNSVQESIGELKQRLSLSPTSTLDPSHLLSFRLHCCCSHEGAITVQCACISPTLVYQATPIKSIPIVSTALARNLSGPLPLSALQGRIKHGYVTMESSRKLVLLLHSDPIVSTLPLVGVWVSGVETVHHPQVWAACVAYTNSVGLTDRVWGGGGGDGNTFICLVYYEGCSQPSFWECQLKEGNETPFEIGSGEAVPKFTSEHNLVAVRISPAQESTALHTLLETALASGSSDYNLLRSLPTHPFSGSSSPATAQPCDLHNDVSMDLPLPLPLPTPSQAPQRVIKDKNLSVISSLSILDSSYVNSPEANVVSERLSQSSPQDKKTRQDSFQALSPVNHPKDKSAPTQEVTTPTNNEVSPQTHLILQQYEHQLKSLQDEVRCLLQAQSPSVPVLPSPTTPTADASTNTGVSLCWPHSSVTPTPPNSSQCSDCDEEETIGPCITSAEISVQTSTTSVLSHITANMHLDLQSFAHSSSVSVTSLQGFGDSASISGGLEHHPLGGTISPSSFPTQNQQWTTEDILADALEKVQILEQLQSQRHKSPKDNDPGNREEEISLPSHGSSFVDDAKDSPIRLSSRESKRLVDHNSGSIDENEGSDFSERYRVGCVGVLPGTHGQSVQTRSVNSSLSSCTSGRSIVSDYLQWRNKDDDKTPTPPHDSRRSNHAPYECITPPLPKDTKIESEPVQYPLRNNQQLPFVTPLSAKSGSPYHLHPDALCQQYSSDISMLPVPRIVCPNNGETMLLTALMGNDVTVDENVYLADMIALKYLQGVKDSRNLMGFGAERWNASDPVLINDNVGADGNMSMATHQYFQRHNLMGGKKLERTIQEKESDKETEAIRISSPNDILDIQALKTLPKLV